MGTEDDESNWIECRSHGRGRCAIVCRHHILERTHPIGFVDNSPAPDDLQAWCHACKRLFVTEGDMTPAFLAFNDFAVVCVRCFDVIRSKHTVASA